MQAILANEIRTVPAAVLPMSEGCEDEAAFLDDLLDDIWEMLAQGVRVRCAPAHTPTLATIRAGFPSVRTVVLREVDRQHAMLLIHTDRRSGKIAELAAEAACSAHVYDPGRQVQLRIEARATLHLDDEVADRRWARTQHMSRVVYGSELAPGTATDDPEAATADLDRIPDSGFGAAPEFRRDRAACLDDRMAEAQLEWASPRAFRAGRCAAFGLARALKLPT